MKNKYTIKINELTDQTVITVTEPRSFLGLIPYNKTKEKHIVKTKDSYHFRAAIETLQSIQDKYSVADENVSLSRFKIER